jgi:hypothetical protein
VTLLSIVVPCFNEQEVLAETAMRLRVLIDDLQAQAGAISSVALRADIL